MTAKYIADTNSLQELSQIKQPIKRIGQFKVGTREYYQNVREWAKYNSHTATLRRIPCDLSCREVFKDNQVYQEGRDYEVREIKHVHRPSEMVSYQPTAFPITVKTEDELWDNAIEIYRRHIFTGHKNAIAEAKKHYTLIKK